MKSKIVSFGALLGILLAVFATRARSADDPLADATRKIASEITENGKAFANLQELAAARAPA